MQKYFGICKILISHFDLCIKMAELTRIELATSGVTGQRSNQLNYSSEKMVSPAGFEPTFSP